MNSICAVNDHEKNASPQLEISAKPKMLVHFSSAKVEEFTGPVGEFKVKTQGRVYALDLDTRFANTTTANKTRSVLVFTHDALKHFHRHPWEIIHFWKPLSGQYRTVKLGDIAWNSADTIRIDENILQIKKIRNLSSPSFRMMWQRVKIIAVRAVSFFIALGLLAVAGLYVLSECSIEVPRSVFLVLEALIDVLPSHQSILGKFFNIVRDYQTPAVVAGTALCASLFVYARIKTHKVVAFYSEKLKTIKTE